MKREWKNYLTSHSMETKKIIRIEKRVQSIPSQKRRLRTTDSLYMTPGLRIGWNQAAALGLTPQKNVDPY